MSVSVRGRGEVEHGRDAHHPVWMNVCPQCSQVRLPADEWEWRCSQRPRGGSDGIIRIFILRLSNISRIRFSLIVPGDDEDEYYYYSNEAHERRCSHEDAQMPPQVSLLL